MSEEDQSPDTNEEQVITIMRNMFTTEYALSDPDRALVFRLMEYGNDKTGLTEEEIAFLKTRGLMDKESLFIIPEELWFRGLVTPSFWLKCLLAFHDMMDFSKLVIAK